MKKRLFFIITIFLVLALPISTFANPANPAGAFDQRVVSQIDADKMMDMMTHLVEDVGPRVACSPEERYVAEYLAGAYEAYGLDVEIQEFAFKNSVAYLSVVEPEVQDIFIRVGLPTLGRVASPSIATEPGGITAEVIDCGYGGEGEFPAKVEGNIALVKATGDFARSKWITDEYTRAVEAGAAGLLLEGVDWNSWFDARVSVITPEIPYGSVSKEMGEILREEGVVVNFQVYFHDTTQNVIATQKPKNPRRATDDVIVVVAHYDTHPASPGASDNTSGTVALLEIARVLSKFPVDTEIRYLSVGAEEFGLLGARHYVDTLPQEELDRIIGAFNMDMIGSNHEVVTHLVVNSRERFGDPTNFTDHLVPNVLTETGHRLGYGNLMGFLYRGSGSDHIPFLQAGISSANLSWRGIGEQPRLEPYYHTSYDTVDKICPERLKIGAQVCASAVYNLARPQTPALDNANIRNRSSLTVNLLSH